MSWVPDDVIDISLAAAVEDWRRIQARPAVKPGERQEAYNPVEVILSMMASFFVDQRSFGGSNAHTVPSPVPELSALFKRPSSSVIAKMANLTGAMANGAKGDQEVGTAFQDDPASLLWSYGVVREAAILAGVQADQIPEMATLPLLPRWVGTPVSGAMARYVLTRWDAVSEEMGHQLPIRWSLSTKEKWR